ncbi:MAG: 3,4-dehydroadipyl-CoA semialdehyde dehydrogenase [Deltaproteobacteria bacterium]|nr:3,4-dehydroadipyl-CoA semialdehyde dehydrogenase [Deltaproteobacteria bacterium]
MNRLKSFLAGKWNEGLTAPTALLNPATEEPLAEIATGGTDLAAAVGFAREVGGPALREMTFKQRGERLQKMAKVIHAHRDTLIHLAIQNGGNTRGDAKFDVDGAMGTLSFYAELAETLGDTSVLVDGEGVKLGRSPRLYGQHVLSPRCGVAVHIGAFNFPAWGAAEKAACALLAGMPIISKPATATALVAHKMTELVLEAGILPEGAFQLLLGQVGDLFDHLGGQDVVAFTGSSATGAKLRGNPRLVSENVRVNIEADSLNAAVLGPDAQVGSPTYDLFLADVVRDMTQKTGQKCTAIRRVLVPEPLEARVREDLCERLSAIKVGNPMLDEVTMGPLATSSQLADVRAGVAKLRAETEVVLSGLQASPLGVPSGKGFFFGPTLLRCPRSGPSSAVHCHEVFGPVSTVIPYDGTAQAAVEIVRWGAGGLVSSVYSDDRAFLTDMVLGLSPFHGRLYLGSAKIADKAPGPGTALPQLVHGGPGRAGAGEELGGLRGMALYLQRTALQGDKALIDAITGRG